MAALYKQQLGDAIARRRVELGLTQRDLAERAHIREATTVSRWERGERSPTDLEAVARALDTTASELLATLSPITQADRRRMVRGEGTQLDRIEAELARVRALLEGTSGSAAAGVPVAPPGQLGRELEGDQPIAPDRRRGERRQEPGA